MENVTRSGHETSWYVCEWGGGVRGREHLTYKNQVSTLLRSLGSARPCLLRFITKPVAHLLFMLKNTFRNQAGLSKFIW